MKIQVVNECINDEQCRVKLLNEKEKIKNLKFKTRCRFRSKSNSCRPHKPTNDGLLESPDINESLDGRGG